MSGRGGRKSTRGDEVTQNSWKQLPPLPLPQGLEGHGEAEAELPEPRGQGHLPIAEL